ncbi:MAG: hypothetical protein RJA70_2020, partial [Pseudomonadota bacterium]
QHTRLRSVIERVKREQENLVPVETVMNAAVLTWEASLDSAHGVSQARSATGVRLLNAEDPRFRLGWMPRVQSPPGRWSLTRATVVS